MNFILIHWIAFNWQLLTRLINHASFMLANKLKDDEMYVKLIQICHQMVDKDSPRDKTVANFNLFPIVKCS
jgi:hypothetical protein